MNEFINPSYLTVNYADWIKRSKLKLKERESALILKRTQHTLSIINKTLCDFYQQYNLWLAPQEFIIDNDIILNVLRILYIKLDGWNGINLNKSRKQYNISSFLEYFKQAKKWWDNCRQPIYGDYYWINIFNLVHQHITNYSNKHYGKKEIFNSSQKIYIKCLFVKVLENLFNDRITLKQTKPLLLISAAVIRCHTIQNYLHYNVDKLLNIHLWMEQTKIIKKTKEPNKKARPVKSTIIATKLKNTFHILSNKLENEFQNHTKVKYYELIQELFMNTTQLQLTVPSNDETMNSVNDCNNGYFGIHQSSNMVSNFRYSPMY